MTAELPGLDEKNIEVNVANGVLTVKGQKEEDKVEKKEDFHLKGATLWLLLAFSSGPRHGRCRQDRGQLQKRRSQSDAAEETGGPEAGQKDRGEGRLRPDLSPDGAFVTRLSAGYGLVGTGPRSPGLKARYWRCDVSSEVEIERVFDEVVAAFGRLGVRRGQIRHRLRTRDRRWLHRSLAAAKPRRRRENRVGRLVGAIRSVLGCGGWRGNKLALLAPLSAAGARGDARRGEIVLCVGPGLLR